MIANVCVSTELLFSLVGLLGLVPLRGGSYPLYIERSPVETGKPDGFRTIRQNRCRRKSLFIPTFSLLHRRCSDFTGEGKIYPVKHTHFTTEVLSRTYIDLCGRDAPISNTNTMILNIPSHNNVSIWSPMALTSANYVRLAETIINLSVITLFYGLH